jgi:pimeloyl-ACP methyl ester carboxylesterase
MTSVVGEAAAVRPFRIDVPEEDLLDLRRRVAATRWPDPETVTNRTQGVQLAKLRPLVEYWGTDYDWRKVEATLNELPQFITEIDGLDIQLAHIRSPHDEAIPLLMTHGWPGSIIELLKVIEPLTNPTAHGGRAEDAFHLVLPTMPGYGFSEKPTTTGWSPARMASAFHELMLRLGYPHYVSQGGDWGAIISELLAVQAPRDSSASTSTCQGPCRRTSSGTSATSTPRPRNCRIARSSPTIGCCTSTTTVSATRR